MRGNPWLCSELTVLRRLYENPKVTWPEIEAAIPRHPRSSIGRMASSMGLRRRRTSKRPMVPIIAQLWERREGLDLTRRDVAERMGYHPIMIGRWERGETRPSLQHLIDWAQVLGMELTMSPKGEARVWR